MSHPGTLTEWIVNEMPARYPKLKRITESQRRFSHMRCVTVQIGDDRIKLPVCVATSASIVDVREDVHCAAQGRRGAEP